LEKERINIYHKRNTCFVGIDMHKDIHCIPDNAEKIYVGKNAGNHPVPQHEINKILLAKALEAKLLLGLKAAIPLYLAEGERSWSSCIKTAYLLR